MSQGDIQSVMASQWAGSVAARREGGEKAEASAREAALAQLQDSRRRALAAAEAGAVQNETQQSFQDKEGDGAFVPGGRQAGPNEGLNENHSSRKDPFGLAGGELDITA